MIWQSARVVARDADRLTLLFSAPESCARCARGEGCGAGAFGRLFSRHETRVCLPSGLEVTSGEWVRIGLDSRQLAVAAGLYYGLPLAGFLGGALAAHFVIPDGDLIALASGLAGFFLSVYFVGRQMRPTLNPVVERLSCSQSDTISTFT